MSSLYDLSREQLAVPPFRHAGKYIRPALTVLNCGFCIFAAQIPETWFGAPRSLLWHPFVNYPRMPVHLTSVNDTIGQCCMARKWESGVEPPCNPNSLDKY